MEWITLGLLFILAIISEFFYWLLPSEKKRTNIPNIPNIPKEYLPFETLVVCGNIFKNGNIPIAIDGNPIFLIGKGTTPRLWLNVKYKNKDWSYVVYDGISTNDNIRVLHNGSASAIYLNEQVILQATKEKDDHMIITHLDFTPFGLAITGDISSLRIGRHQMSNDIFENLYIMINVK